jgi:hypothetical protein
MPLAIESKFFTVQRDSPSSVNGCSVSEQALPTTPKTIPIPGRLILFSPHPDDIAISMGAFAGWAAPRVPVTRRTLCQEKLR